ncbi:MAG: TetR/AcrR family transcriptional regulator [Myxococcales bacterium]|nr:TetR/AcrR family transcriptional regulator [Myxococcales bacterium]
MPRPRNTEARREQIIDGLLAVMGERGYERATVAAIARAAALSPGLIHYHFTSKRAILLALVEQLVARFEARRDALLRRAGNDPKDRIDAFVSAYLARGAGEDPAVVAAWVVVGAEATRQPEVRAIYRRAIAARLDALTDLLRARLRQRGRSGRGAKRLAAGVIAAIEGAYQLAAAAPELLPAGYAAPAVRQMIEGATERAPPR